MRRSLSVMCLCLVVLCLYPSFAGCGGSEPEIVFPYSLEIAEGNHLIVMGHHFTGTVVLTWEPGDTLRIEGIPVVPKRKLPERRPSEEELESLYGNVPYVMQLVDSGASWHDASASYGLVRGELSKTLERVYWDTVNETGSEDLALQAVWNALDWSLVDSTAVQKVSPRGVILVWKGMKHSHTIEFRDSHPDSFTKPPPKHHSAKYVADWVKRLSGRLSGKKGGPWMEVIYPGRTSLGGKSVAEALRQFRDAADGKRTDGPLSKYEVELIIKEGRETE